MDAPLDPFSHLQTVLEDLRPGKRFLLAARPDIEALATPNGVPLGTPAVPYPTALVQRMQRTHAERPPRDGGPVNADVTVSIQHQLTWNRVIATVSGSLAAAYRMRSLPSGACFAALGHTPHQTHYFAHRTRVRGWPIEGYWVRRDLCGHGHGQPWLLVQPVVADPLRCLRMRSTGLHTFAIPLLDTWQASVRAGAAERARSSADGQALLASQAFEARAAAWAPVVSLVFDALTGPGGSAYEQASKRVAFSEVGIRDLVLCLDRGELVVRGAWRAPDAGQGTTR